MDQLCNKSEKATTLVFAQINWWHEINFITLLKSLKTLHLQMSDLSQMYLPVLLAIYVCLELGWSTTLKASCHSFCPFFGTGDMILSVRWCHSLDYIEELIGLMLSPVRMMKSTCCCVDVQNFRFVFVLLMFKMLRLQSGVWKSFTLMDRHHWHNYEIPSFMTPRAKWEASKIFTFALQVFACSLTSGLHLGPNVWT